jgi:hypothetical protein
MDQNLNVPPVERSREDRIAGPGVATDYINNVEESKKFMEDPSAVASRFSKRMDKNVPDSR